MSDQTVRFPGLRTVEVGSAQGRHWLACAETGEGVDTVFLFHGVTANHRVWAPIQRALEQRYRVISVDQRGHGNSGKPKDGYRAVDFSDDIGQLLGLLGGTGKNVLVGHSLGSRNAIVAATRFSDAIDGIVAIDFTPFIEDEVFDTLAARVGSGDQRFGSTEEVEAYLHRRYPLMPADAVARRAEYGYQLDDGALVPLADAEAMRATVDGLREDLSESLRALAVPAVVVRGADSTLVSERAFRRTQELRPDLDYVVVPEADHYVPEERPEAVTEIISGFIDRL